MSHSSPDKKERSLDAWKLYTSIFNEFFGDYEGAYTLSPAVLLEFADRLKAQPANAFTEYNAALSARNAIIEECAKVCDDRFKAIERDTSGDTTYYYLDELENAAKAIRALSDGKADG